MSVILRIVLVLACILVSVVAELAHSLGGFVQLHESIVDGHGSFPAARIGGAFVVVFVLVIAFALALALLNVLTAAGLLALMKGMILGIVLNCLLDFFLIRGKVERANRLHIRRWAARGAMLTLLFALWVGLINPALSRLGPRPAPFPSLSEAIGIFSVTGIFACGAFAFAGWISYRRARRTAAPSGDAS
jgi:hypothetical protein